MAQLGMDVDAVQGAAKQIASCADQLQQTLGRIDGLLRHLPATWSGADAQRFSGQVWPPLRRQYIAVQQEAAALRDALTREIDEQERASAVVGNGSVLPGYLALHSPGQILSDADGLLDTKVGPFEIGGLAKILIPGAGYVADTLGIAARISNGQVPWSEMLGVVAGGVQDAAKSVPVLELGATAVKVWLDAADQASKADFSPQQMQTNGNYIRSHPAEAVAAAGEAIVGWVPNLLDDFGLKL